MTINVQKKQLCFNDEINAILKNICVNIENILKYTSSKNKSSKNENMKHYYKVKEKYIVVKIKKKTECGLCHHRNLSETEKEKKTEYVRNRHKIFF